MTSNIAIAATMNVEAIGGRPFLVNDGSFPKDNRMDRRGFLNLAMTSAAVASPVAARFALCGIDDRPGSSTLQPSAASIEPVVADGRWIWNEPPMGETGYLDPRPFSLATHIEMIGNGSATGVVATTPVPVEFPEQSIADVKLEGIGCRAQLRELGAGAAQLVLLAGSIRKGQTIRATATFQMVLRKQYAGYERDSFPASQGKLPAAVRVWLNESPGIQVKDSSVKKLARELVAGIDHPWERAKRFHDWSMNEIRPQVGRYTSVVEAIRKRRGDCEERSSVFVALCRAVGIPARLVWVPQHNWSEFYLVDHDGEGHWIPSHTAAYDWFGWTGAHELVIQKGDRVRVPEKREPQRLQVDWAQWRGAKPEMSFTAELNPVAESPGGDPGPGARRKLPSGRWELVKRHEMDRYARSG